MICPNCRAQLPDDTVVCPLCHAIFDHDSHTYYTPDLANYVPDGINKNFKNESHTENLKGNNTKICPTCGAQLPSTAKMCHSCKTMFDATFAAKYYANTGALESPSNQQYPTYTQSKSKDDLKALLYILNAVTLGFVLMGVIGMLAPYFTASYSFESFSMTFNETGDAIFLWVPLGLIAVLSIPGIYYNDGVTIAKAVISLLATGVVGICAWYISKEIKEKLADTQYAKGTIFNLSSGFYLLLAGFILVFIVSLLQFPLVYKKK